jgi:hypothetical protein
MSRAAGLGLEPLDGGVADRIAAARPRITDHLVGVMFVVCSVPVRSSPYPEQVAPAAR